MLDALGDFSGATGESTGRLDEKPNRKRCEEKMLGECWCSW